VTGYQQAMCSVGAYQRASGSPNAERLRQQAVSELEAFVASAEALNPVPAQVQAALTDARTRLAQLGD